MLFEVWLGDLSPDAANDGCVSEAETYGSSAVDMESTCTSA
jgi:hypothetical protein